MNVNFLLRSSANSRRLSSCCLRSSLIGCVGWLLFCVLWCCWISAIYFSSSSILRFYLASIVLPSNSIRYSIFLRYSCSSVLDSMPFLVRVRLPWDSMDYYLPLISASSSLSFLEASSYCWSFYSILVSFSSNFVAICLCAMAVLWDVWSMRVFSSAI